MNLITPSIWVVSNQQTVTTVTSTAADSKRVTMNSCICMNLTSMETDRLTKSSRIQFWEIRAFLGIEYCFYL